MPIIYKNNNKDMKTINEMSQAEAIEYIRIKNISPYTGYRTEELNTMVQFVKEYVDPKQAGCASCGSTITEAKNKFVRFYLDNKDVMENIANGIKEEPKFELTEETKQIIENEPLEVQNKNKRKRK